MLGVIELVESCTPTWDAVIWEFFVGLRFENAARERSRVSPNRAEQKRQASRRYDKRNADKRRQQWREAKARAKARKAGSHD